MLPIKQGKQIRNAKVDYKVLLNDVINTIVFDSVFLEKRMSLIENYFNEWYNDHNLPAMKSFSGFLFETEMLIVQINRKIAQSP